MNELYDEYAAYRQGVLIEKNREEGREEGRVESQMETAKRMCERGCATYVIADILDVPQGMIENWINQK